MHIPENDPTPEPLENATGIPLPPPPSLPLESPLAETLGAVATPDLQSVPPDLRTPLHGVDLLFLLLFYFIGGVVLVFVTAAVAMAVFGVPQAALEESTAARGSVLIVSQALLSVATLGLLFAIIRSRGTADFWPSVGWFPLRGAVRRSATIMRYVLFGVVLALAVGYASRFFDQGKDLPMEDLFRSRQTALLLMVMGILVAPLVEETVFRGCIYPVLARKLGAGFGVVSTGVLFGLAHAPQLWPGIGQIALLMCVGITLTVIRARSGTVFASYLVHLGYNTVLFAGFFLATGGLQHLPS